MVKKLFKAVHIYQSYRQNNPGVRFLDHTVIKSELLLLLLLLTDHFHLPLFLLQYPKRRNWFLRYVPFTMQSACNVYHGDKFLAPKMHQNAPFSTQKSLNFSPRAKRETPSIHLNRRFN